MNTAVKKAATVRPRQRGQPIAKRQAKFRPLGDDERRRFRRAFDYYDADEPVGSTCRSSKRDGRQWDDAALLRGEALQEADTDGNGTVDFEVLRFVQLYKATELLRDDHGEADGPDLAGAGVQADPFAPFLSKMRRAGCNQTAIGFKYNYLKLISKENLMVQRSTSCPSTICPTCRSSR